MKCAFPPVADSKARVLILGSMPGEASLAARQYYAFPRNHFWSIMGELVGASPALPYAQRLAALCRAGIALWDVLERCEREGSLDTAINEETLIANDFASFLRRHKRIEHIFFNGKSVARLFRVHKSWKRGNWFGIRYSRKWHSHRRVSACRDRQSFPHRRVRSPSSPYQYWPRRAARGT